ncbi:hypothetical protein [Candidatus Avelusimicrobium fimicolum]|uniref:hypothetical protein n=1 Tax=Candidatus Avelusimicrobium fimicolum TaxID=3416216 RepID=UPI003D140077
MCDPVSAVVGIVSAAASIGMSAKNAHDQRKAAREAQKVQEDTERKQKALLEAKGAAQTSRTDTAATEAERKRRTAVANNTVLTSRQGALGTPNTAGTALYSGIASRNTLG